jgi:hypothetical protein
MLYLIAKSSHVGTDVDGLACSLHHPAACSHQEGSQSFLVGAALSYCATVGSVVFLRGAKPPGLNILRGVNRPGICKTESHMEKFAFTDGILIRRQSYHGDYVCTLGIVAMSGGDGMDYST